MVEWITLFTISCAVVILIVCGWFIWFCYREMSTTIAKPEQPTTIADIPQ